MLLWPGHFDVMVNNLVLSTLSAEFRLYCLYPLLRSKTSPPKMEASMVSIFINPSTQAGYNTRSIFKRSLTGLNSEFCFSKTSCLTKAEELSLPCYLPIAGGTRIGFIPFPRVLVLCEMQSVSCRIWTRVAVSISCDDNHYTMEVSMVSYGTVSDGKDPLRSQGQCGEPLNYNYS